MKTAVVTKAFLDNPPAVGGYSVSVAWRYGITGPFTGASPASTVRNDGTLNVPVVINYDEVINPTIQIRVTYLGCTPSAAYLRSYTAP
jgi:hypothetical protein